MTEFQLVGLFFLAIPVLLLVMIWAIRRRTRSIVNNGHRTEATILSQEYLSGEGASAWRAEVRYTDFEGNVNQKKLEVGPRRITTDTVAVIYDTRKPSRVMVVNDSAHPTPFVSRLLVAVALAAIAALGIVFIVTAWGEPL